MEAPHDQGGPRILIVDDDTDISELLAELLSARGYRVRVAANGKQGLWALREELPDLVILDVEMPQLTGPEMAYQMIVENTGMERIPVLLVSGIVGLPAVAARVGTPYSLPKPAPIDQILALIERALAEKIAPTPADRP